MKHSVLVLLFSNEKFTSFVITSIWTKIVDYSKHISVFEELLSAPNRESVIQNHRLSYDPVFSHLQLNAPVGISKGVN